MLTNKISIKQIITTTLLALVVIWIVFKAELAWMYLSYVLSDPRPTTIQSTALSQKYQQMNRFENAALLGKWRWQYDDFLMTSIQLDIQTDNLKATIHSWRVNRSITATADYKINGMTLQYSNVQGATGILSTNGLLIKSIHKKKLITVDSKDTEMVFTRIE
jgi:hypothetical protein